MRVTTHIYISASTLFFQIVFPKDQTFFFPFTRIISSRLAFSRIAPWLDQLSKGARRQWEESVGSGPSGSRGGWCKHAGRGWMGNGRNKASYYQQMVDYIDPPSFLPFFLPSFFLLPSSCRSSSSLTPGISPFRAFITPLGVVVVVVVVALPITTRDPLRSAN